MPGGSQSICNAYIHCQSISKIGFSDFNRIFNGNNLFESCTLKGQKYSYGKIDFHSTANERRALMEDRPRVLEEQPSHTFCRLPVIFGGVEGGQAAGKGSKESGRERGMAEDKPVDRLSGMVESCVECRMCQQECEFLSHYGTPKQLARSFDPGIQALRDAPFACSLCGLCESVCPVGLSPARMLLEMRRRSVGHARAAYSQHGRIFQYEARGISRRYTHYALPRGCDTVFFPGCTLSGARPETVLQVFQCLRGHSPSLGIVLDCCTKPSHDLGRQEHFEAVFGEMKAYLVEHGVRTVLVACPSCYSVFKEYGGDLAVRTVYELLLEAGLPRGGTASGTVTVHDPCAVRDEQAIHEAVRALIRAQGLPIQEMEHHGRTTLCCGEGGAVGFFSPKFSRNWRDRRKMEAADRRIITYCSGCVNLLGAVTPTSHVLDLIFEPRATLAGKIRASKAPFTYWNRLRLKRRFKKTLKAAVTRERNLY